MTSPLMLAARLGCHRGSLEGQWAKPLPKIPCFQSLSAACLQQVLPCAQVCGTAHDIILFTAPSSKHSRQVTQLHSLFMGNEAICQMSTCPTLQLNQS